MEKRIYVLVGSSGSGKTTLGAFLMENGIPKVVTHTTRKMRKGEVDGIDYHFVDIETFNNIEKIESAEYSGNYYGVSKREIDDKLKNDDKIHIITEISGAMSLKKIYGDIVKVIFIKVTKKDMEDRMRHRGDSKEQIKKRLAHCDDSDELKNEKFADKIILNQDLEKTKEELLHYVSK